MVILLGLPPLAGSAATLYKCRAADGTISYRDSPCADRAATLATRKLKRTRIPDAVDDEEYLEPDAGPVDEQALYVFKAQFQQALSSLTPLRVASVEYFMNTGEWPKDFKAVGVDKKSMSSSFIDGVRIAPQGRIVAELNEQKFGQQKKIVLTPHQVMGGTTVEWQCSSNFTPRLLGSDATRICQSRVIH